MGLEDIVDEKTPDSSTSRSRSGSNEVRGVSSSDEYFKVVGSPPLQKVFQEEEDWEETAKVLRDVMGHQPNNVLNMPAEQRFEILHEARLWSEGQLEESEHESEDKCVVCNKACTGSCTEIAGQQVHVHHTVGQLGSMLEEE